MIPIKIETLLEGRKVEQNRIEYKEGFKTSEIVHTICGYASDIAGVDGGYLVIGVKTENGIPVLTQKDHGKVRRIVNYMEEHGEITPKEAETITGKSAATARRYL